MPKPDAARDSLFKYLKFDFPWKRDWDTMAIPHIKDVYTYAEIKTAMQELGKINPEIHKYLSYLVNSGRNRNDLGSYFQCDTSTLKRKCNRGFDIMLNFLNNPDAFTELKPIDLRLQ